MLPPRELHMSASIIPPLPDPPSSPLTSPLPPLQFFRLTSVSFVSLPPYDGGERGTLLDSLPPVGGFTSPSLPPPLTLVVQRVSIPLSIFPPPPSFSLGLRPPRTSIESFLPAEPTGHTARLFSSHLLCKRTQSRPVTLPRTLLLR